MLGEPGVGTYGTLVESATAERGGVFATVAGTLGEWVEYKVRVDEESDGLEELVTVRLFFFFLISVCTLCANGEILIEFFLIVSTL